jgi:hypothetical protein
MNNEMGGQDDKAAEDDEDVDEDPAAGSEGEDHDEDEDAKDEDDDDVLGNEGDADNDNTPRTRKYRPRKGRSPIKSKWLVSSLKIRLRRDQTCHTRSVFMCCTSMPGENSSPKRFYSLQYN